MGLGSYYPIPCEGAPNHSGVFSAAASAGTNTPLSPRTEFLPIPVNDPHLPAPLHVSARWRSGELRVLYPVPYLTFSSWVIRSVWRDLIVFVVVVLVTLEISPLCTSYHQLPPPQSKNWLCQLLCMPRLNKPTKSIFHEMHPGVRTEVQTSALLHQVMTTILCHLYQNSGPGSKL